MFFTLIVVKHFVSCIAKFYTKKTIIIIIIVLQPTLLVIACLLMLLLISLSICSYRFMDMFPDTALVREIQRELDDIIQQGVRNITRLIRATDTTITDPLQTQGIRRGNSGTASSNNLTSKGQRGQRGSGELMDSSLASRLVRDGLLTPDLLRQLQSEWSKDQKQEFTYQSALDTEHPNNNNKGKRKKKKK